MKPLFIAIASASLVVAAPALSETQTENVVAEQRTSIALRVAPETVQSFLPAGWVVNTPAAGANLTVIFMDQKLALTPDGKPLNAGFNRRMVLAVPARNAANGQTRNMIVGGYSNDPAGAPGAYKVYRPGAVTMTRIERSGAALESEVEEHWEAKGSDGVTVRLDLVFARGAPTLSTFESKNYSGADPEFYRTYRGQQASEPLRNAAGVNRVRSMTLKASGGTLGKAINGSEQIVAITSTPFYSRLTFVP